MSGWAWLGVAGGAILFFAVIDLIEAKAHEIRKRSK